MRKTIVLCLVTLILSGCSSTVSKESSATHREAATGRKQKNFKLFTGNKKEVGEIKKKFSEKGFDNVRVIPFDSGVSN
ncbi:hypothetical protein [Pediococcus claussenii]|uniref:hypothetical protein n=1 Tax=Pediococcus claussenii TaxID=187452 RepID=UPI0005A21C3F|nr:hypothetical protein [Pediococcus claussenii]ANZ69103.1 hypothetical protein AYR57_01765 [Pediococcus claussenii]ANZ70920.1 hypothetical protein AYR58_01765 [Pediococcus claussenii]